MIQAIGLRREDVYITSIVKCRPPQNRDPEPEEIAMCVPFLRRQIESIQPRLLCALGRVAAQTLLETTTPISQLRGRFHEYDGIKLMPTFHPAYLLRNPHDKRLAWEI
jgi:DNA polymerase